MKPYEILLKTCEVGEGFAELATQPGLDDFFSLKILDGLMGTEKILDSCRPLVTGDPDGVNELHRRMDGIRSAITEHMRRLGKEKVEEHLAYRARTFSTQTWVRDA